MYVAQTSKALGTEGMEDGVGRARVPRVDFDADSAYCSHGAKCIHRDGLWHAKRTRDRLADEQHDSL